MKKFALEIDFNFSFELAPQVNEKTLIPPMIIQTLVENSIKHGLANKVDSGQIEIQMSLKENKLFLVVQDNGVGIEAKSNGNGTGLKNLKNRLRLFYDKQASISQINRIPSGLRTEMMIPLNPPEDRMEMEKDHGET